MKTNSIYCFVPALLAYKTMRQYLYSLRLPLYCFMLL